MICKTDRSVQVDRVVPQGAREPLVGLLAQLRLDPVLAQARGQVEDPRHFLHLGRVDVGGADLEEELLLPLEQGHLAVALGAVDVAVLGGVQEVAPLDRAPGDRVGGALGLLGRPERQLGGVAIPERCEQPDAPEEQRVVVGDLGAAGSWRRGRSGTSLMSLIVNSRSCSMLAPALTTLNRSADSGVSSALAISRPSRGW